MISYNFLVFGVADASCYRFESECAVGAAVCPAALFQPGISPSTRYVVSRRSALQQPDHTLRQFTPRYAQQARIHLFIERLARRLSLFFMLSGTGRDIIDGDGIEADMRMDGNDDAEREIDREH